MCCLGVGEGPHHSEQLVPTPRGLLRYPPTEPVTFQWVTASSLDTRQCPSLQNLMTWHHCGPGQLFKESHKSGPVSRLQK